MPPAPRGASISEGPSLVPEVRAIRARNYMTWPLLGSYVARAPPPANAAARKPPPNKFLSFQPSSRHSERVSCHSERSEESAVPSLSPAPLVVPLAARDASLPPADARRGTGKSIGDPRCSRAVIHRPTL